MVRLDRGATQKALRGVEWKHAPKTVDCSYLPNIANVNTLAPELSIWHSDKQKGVGVHP